MKKSINICEKDGRRVVEGLGYYTARKISDIRELIKNSAEKYGDLIAFKIKEKKGQFVEKSFKQFDREIDCLGTGLISLGLKDEKIAIIGENRYEWGLSYFSILNGTGVAVPLDKLLPINEIKNLIERGKTKAIFYSAAFHKAMKDISSQSDTINKFICMDDLEEIKDDDSKFTTISQVMKTGEKLLDGGDRSFVDAVIDRTKMTVLLFTSGTTSISKGVMLSHENIAFEISTFTTFINIKPGDVHLSLLPLHHTFENVIGLMYMVYMGACIAYCDGLKYVAKNLQEYKVTILIVVPAILESMYKKLQDGIDKSGKRKLVNTMIAVSDVLRKIGIDLRRVMFKSILNQLGPNLRLAVSGAAPLDPEIVRYFDKIGLTLLQGYGITETSPVVAGNNDFLNIPGSVGYPLMGIEVAIDAPDENGVGEIVTRGKNVMLGYFEDEVATKEAIDEKGWFKTGDLGFIDRDGILRITGRLKSMIVLPNGKKAFPEEYEVLLNNFAGIKDSIVWGNTTADGDVHICAKIVVDKDKMVDEEGKAVNEKDLASRFEAMIKEINKNLPQYKVIKYFIMTQEELVKTTTLKIKRAIEHERISNALERAGLEMRKASGRFV